MKFRAAVALVVGAALTSCYGNPRRNFGDADGGAADGQAGGNGGGPKGGADGGAGVGNDGRGGSSGGGGVGGAQGGSSGSVGTGGTAGTVSGPGGAAGTGAGGVAGAGGAAVCTPACDATHACSAGRCLLADAQPCVTAAQCASSACNPFYRDVDADGYGTGQAVGFCTLTSAPIGYAAQTGDCCDDAANVALAKLIHPGADFQPTSADGICGGITWDYDCDGTIASNPQTVACGSDYPSCTRTMVNFQETSCGSTAVEDCTCTTAGQACTRPCSGHVGKILCK